mmetsp:Transcript_22825/g.20300  ORF Transcript_22825/g.20300 Transcript_22825/m.20300 type:complete len:190 (+) Transcript_22825:965-1534(+)
MKNLTFKTISVNKPSNTSGSPKTGLNLKLKRASVDLPSVSFSFHKKLTSSFDSKASQIYGLADKNRSFRVNTNICKTPVSLGLGSHTFRSISQQKKEKIENFRETQAQRIIAASESMPINFKDMNNLNTINQYKDTKLPNRAQVKWVFKKEKHDLLRKLYQKRLEKYSQSSMSKNNNSKIIIDKTKVFI